MYTYAIWEHQAFRSGCKSTRLAGWIREPSTSGTWQFKPFGPRFCPNTGRVLHEELDKPIHNRTFTMSRVIK